MTGENPSRSQSLKQAAANIPAAFRLVWDAHHIATIVMALLDGQRPQPNAVSVRAREDNRATPPLEPLHVARPQRASNHARHNLLPLKQ